MKTAYINGIILDGTLDMVPVSGKTIIVENKKIVSICEAEKAEISGCKVVDLGGKYILPGLINLHAHLAGTGKPLKRPVNLPLLCKLVKSNPIGRAIGKSLGATGVKNALLGGITTIRAVGGISNFDTAVRDDIKKGKLVGPRVLAADAAITVEGGHMAKSFSVEALTKEDAVAMIEKIARKKPDLIKLMVTGGITDTDEVGLPGVLLMPPDYIKAACDKAHALGYKVAAHAEGYEGVIASLENGVDTIEHGAEPDEKMIELFKKTGAASVITLSPVIPYIKRFKNMFNVSEAAVINAEILLKGMVALAKECIKNGIKVGLGTDSSCIYVTQYDFWREVAYFVEYCGVSNNFALHTATQVNAEIAGVSDITGSIEEGKMADMIVVSGNPLENIKALRDIKMVVMEGKLIDNIQLKRFPEVEKAFDN